MRPGDIRRRTITLFVLGIVIPSSLLAYLAFRGVRNDQALLERERRDSLRQLLDDVVLAHVATLTLLGDSLGAIIAGAGGDGEAPNAIAAWVKRTPLVDAAFRLSPEDRIDRLIAPHQLYGSEPGMDEVGRPVASDPALWRARRREFAEADLRGALEMYRDIVRTGSRREVRADALSAVARLERNLDNWPASLDVYARLATEYGDVLTAGGIPFRLAAGLESGLTEHDAGDAEAAARTLVALYADVMRAGASLSGSQYAFLAGHAQDGASSAIADITVLSVRETLADSLERLIARQESARDLTERLLVFERQASPTLSVRRSRAGEGADDYMRFGIDIETHSYPVQLDVAGDGRADGTWGLLFNEDHLVASLQADIAARTAGGDVDWALLNSTGTPVRGSGTATDQRAAMSAGVPDGIPALTIALYPSGAGFVRTWLTSRRGIFFYAFVLLAGILVVGLVLTLNTISHQLELSRMQSDFVSTVSHEFRSPLTAIRQIGEMLQAGQVSSESKRRRYHDVLVEQSERLSLLVNRVLDFARMESGQHTLTTQRVDANALLDELISQTQHRVDHRGFAIRREIDDDLPHLNADPDALKEALSNLIDNAIKYSGDARELVVRGFESNGQVVVSVRDFGRGLDVVERSRVFERFYRGGDPLTRSVKGTGLGLTMVKHIVEGHNGTVDVESTPGQGSTFTVRLPVESGAHE